MKADRLSFAYTGKVFLALCFLSISLCACPMIPKEIIALKAPNKPKREQIRWFRAEFYELYLVEVKAKDGGDRLRRYIQKFPKIAGYTYHSNQADLKRYQKNGKPPGQIEKYYLLMNLLIEETIGIPKTKTKPDLSKR